MMMCCKVKFLQVTSDGNMIKISFSIDCNDAPDYEDSDILLGATVLVPAVGEPVVNVVRCHLQAVSCCMQYI